MSNFGRLGSAMVNDGIAVSQEMRRQDIYEANEPGRDLAGAQNKRNSDTLQAEIDLAGGADAYAKREAKRADVDWKRQQTLKDLKVENQRAKNAKVSAEALTKATQTAATAGKTGSSSVYVKYVP